jgi:PIN domain nuclease of toxin-antitoxin system
MNEWLLDTGVLLWWLAADPRLSFIVRTRITQSATRVFVSVATAWEVASLARQGRLDLGEPPEICLPREIALHRFLWLPLEARHVLRAQALPREGRDGRDAAHAGRGALDPYDRLLVAQAALDGLSIVTTDVRLATHGVAIVEALERAVPARAKRPRVGRGLGPERPIRMGGPEGNVRSTPRPVRRSGDDLEGEEEADPAEPRTLENPSGAPGAGQACEPEHALEPGADAEPASESKRVPGPDRAPGPGWAPGRGGAVDPGGTADIVTLRPIPRWNAFPWGGTFSGRGEREERGDEGERGER